MKANIKKIKAYSLFLTTLITPFLLLFEVAAAQEMSHTPQSLLLWLKSGSLKQSGRSVILNPGSVSFHNDTHLNVSEGKTTLSVVYKTLEVLHSLPDSTDGSSPLPWPDQLTGDLSEHYGEIGKTIEQPFSNISFIVAFNKRDTENSTTVFSSIIKLDFDRKDNQWQSEVVVSSLDTPALKHIVSMTFTPDGRFFAAVASETETLLLFSRNNPSKKWQLIKSFTNPADLQEADSWYGVRDVTSSAPANDKIICFFVCTDRFVHLIALNRDGQWEYNNEATLIPYQNMPYRLNSIASSPDGRSVVAVGEDNTIHTFRYVSSPLFGDGKYRFDYDEADVEKGLLAVGFLSVTDPNQPENKDYSQLTVTVRSSASKKNCPFIWRDNSLIVNSECDTDLSKSGGWKWSEQWKLTVFAYNEFGQSSQASVVVNVKPSDYTSRVLKTVFAPLIPLLVVSGSVGWLLIKRYRSRRGPYDLGDETPEDSPDGGGSTRVDLEAFVAPGSETIGLRVIRSQERLLFTSSQERLLFTSSQERLPLTSSQERLPLTSSQEPHSTQSDTHRYPSQLQKLFEIRGGRENYECTATGKSVIRLYEWRKKNSSASAEDL